jgi:hypothetical protein
MVIVYIPLGEDVAIVDDDATRGNLNPFDPEN